MPERRRKFSSEFRDEAVTMVVGGNRPAAAVARELGINPGTLANWENSHRKARPVADEQLSVGERARLRELESDYRQQQDFWGRSLPDGPLRKNITTESYVPADEIFRIFTENGFLDDPDRFTPEGLLAQLRDGTAWYLTDEDVKLTPELASELKRARNGPFRISLIILGSGSGWSRQSNI